MVYVTLLPFMTRASKEKEPQRVAVTFQAELAAIQEKGKDLKGDQKVFYNSIVERVANNVQVLADQREEHTQLRAKLGELVKEKANLSQRVDLEGDIRHTQHNVNLQKKQCDRLKQERYDSVRAQAELEIVLANFRNADIYEHPENALIADMKTSSTVRTSRTGRLPI
jgi:predicted nuclease with TOPRIM domain